MGTRHIVILQFEADGPAVEGDWSDGSTARRNYRDWVGLYGSDPHVAIQLIEEADGCRRVLKTWTARGEVEGPAI
ncbi:hypothetical protein OHB13_38035 (plasmid) [Streptomyces sp. NBC_00440]|uniref:hypothetical protein n=1 Tax=unclassified Streptomyces TaxID=2593676 RepID=UPI002E208201|nr:hypothetical protein OG760_37390 [Streptomyces sp. NBC_00963]